MAAVAPIRKQSIAERRADVAKANQDVLLVFGRLDRKPLSDTQKACMRAAIAGPLTAIKRQILVDVAGGRHWWNTIRALVGIGVMEAFGTGRGSRYRLTEVGMLAALWLEQEAREGI